MNYTIDLVNSWAEKMTYRLMVMIGVSADDQQKYLKACVDKQNGVTAADETLAVPFDFLGFHFKDIGTAIKYGIFIAGGVLVFVLYKKYSRK